MGERIWQDFVLVSHPISCGEAINRSGVTPDTHACIAEGCGTRWQCDRQTVAVTTF